MSETKIKYLISESENMIIKVNMQEGSLLLEVLKKK